jgi:hypothetical protein
VGEAASPPLSQLGISISSHQGLAFHTSNTPSLLPLHSLPEREKERKKRIEKDPGI